MNRAAPETIHPTGKCTDRDDVARLAAGFGLEVLQGADIALARDVGAAMIGPNLASAATLQRIEEHARAVVFGYREAGRLTGMMALLPLNARGHEALQLGAFDAREPDLDAVAQPGETPHCYYAWGIAALSKDAARALIKASSALHARLFWDIPSYTRAATGDGLRLMTSFGYRPLSLSDPNLLVAPAPGQPGQASL